MTENNTKNAFIH